MALTQEQKDDWVKALRSGRYKQMRGDYCFGKGAARQYCCLGVLERLAGGDPLKIEEHDMWLYEHVGLNTDDLGDFVVANDEHNKTFKEIADMIESGELAC